MKKILTSLFLLFFLVGSSIAQSETPVSTSMAQPLNDASASLLFPQAGDWGVTMNVNGLLSNVQLAPRQDLLGNSTFLVRNTKNSRLTYRVGLAPNMYRFNQISTDSIGKDLVEFDSTARRAMIGIRPGVEYHLQGTKRLDPYVALDAEVGVVGGLSIGSVTNITDTTGTSRVVRTITEDGGYTVGAKLSAGMNYFVAQRLSIGLEYGMGVMSVVSGGDRQEVIQIEPVSGTNTTIRNLSSARTSDLNFYVDPRVQFTISYFFGS